MAYFVGSTTKLNANLTWTSGTKLRERHDTIQGTAFSDVGGTLHVEQSMDGDFTNVDFDTSVTITGGTGSQFNVNMVAPFWRLRYVNGGTNQATFRIQATTQAGGDS